MEMLIDPSFNTEQLHIKHQSGIGRDSVHG